MAAFALPLIGAASSILGGLFGNKGNTTKFSSTQNQSGTSNQSSTSSGYNNPNLTGQQQDLENLINNSVFNSLNKPFDLSGYASNAAENINTGANAGNQLLKQTLAARGLTYSPIAANALAQSDTNRISQQTQLQNSLPLLAEQLFQNRLASAVNAFRSQPFGSTFGGTSSGTNSFSGTSSTSGTQTGPSNMLGGLFGGLGSSLPFLEDLFNGNGGGLFKTSIPID